MVAATSMVTSSSISGRPAFNFKSCLGRSVLHPIIQEALITKRLLQSNAFAIYGGWMFSFFSRYLVVPVSPDKLLRSTLHCLFFTSIFAYVFEIANQTWSSEEDKLNKPTRPIPSGLLTVRQAEKRWLFSWTASLCIIDSFYGHEAMAHMALWQLWVAFCYVWPKTEHWALKSAFTGITAMVSPPTFNIILSGIVPEWKHSLVFDLPMAAWLILSIHIQDFSEVQGDRAANRKTLPIILSQKGMIYLRIWTASFFILSSLGALMWGYVEFQSSHRFNTVMVTGIFQLIMALPVAIRTLTGEGKQIDKRTYNLYYFLALFSLIIHLSFVSLGRRQ
ncbi:hypothetical protein ABW20_dc0104024 [Dactylellina cionopaga]|nr:hypothetical protein ABW20_dc0104024 [Dactylellina cionopaga]